MNWARINAENLENHYVRNCTPPKYYIELLPRRLNQLVDTHGDNWCMVVAGDPDIANDYFVIPFRQFKHLIREEHLTPKGKRSPEPVRWQFQLRDRIMNLYPPEGHKLTADERSINVSEFYGINDLITPQQ